jgi:hypothetical protein
MNSELTSDKLLAHLGHDVSIVTYGSHNLALECSDCSEVLADADTPKPQLDCEWFLDNGQPNREWCCNSHMYAGGEAGIEGEDHPVDCDFKELLID